ncbi:molybdate ABC transporter substrate-binding protein [Oligella urethralis]|uniref:Molybdate ABC transporter substrate-binding protein n=1 Tax=Oligella urethralis DNF00040 TaxID=1401065 RepID=A0A096BB09_9BURK|nr:molybdate ABC transporter substrate-binding protein [Oligella urethralis]KGF30329.1 molybdate ABC transporter substrate-binding protein [Oligella urethralis DNF00040]
MKRTLLSIAALGAVLISPLAVADTIAVSAAASLTNAYTELGKAFEAKNPEHKVEFNFGASGTLLQQILQGAPVDVFASADQQTMDKAVEEGMVKKDSRVDFIGNGLVLIVPKDSKLSFDSLEQLTADNVEHIAMGNPDTTPNARYARAALQKEGLWEKVEPKLVLASNVRQSLSYVSRGEVEAGFVFSTDVKQDEDKVNVALVIPTVAAGEKAGEWVPNPIVYPIAETTQTKSKVSADFIAYVLSDEGQAILAKYGFIPIKDMDK